MTDDLQPRDVALELGIMPQHVYGLLWAGRIKARQDPQTGFWTITRANLEAFKRRKGRKVGRKKANGKADATTASSRSTE